MFSKKTGPQENNHFLPLKHTLNTIILYLFFIQCLILFKFCDFSKWQCTSWLQVGENISHINQSLWEKISAISIRACGSCGRKFQPYQSELVEVVGENISHINQSLWKLWKKISAISIRACGSCGRKYQPYQSELVEVVGENFSHINQSLWKLWEKISAISIRVCGSYGFLDRDTPFQGHMNQTISRIRVKTLHYFNSLTTSDENS